MSTSADGTTRESAALARTLLRLAETRAPERITIAELVGALGDRGPVVATLLLALPNVIPMPPGTSAVLGAPLLVLTLWIAAGGTPRLPALLGRRSFARSDLAPVLRRAAALLARRGDRVHLAALASPRGVRLIGAVCSLFALIVLLPIPFGNMTPALAISMCAFGILRGDGRWVLGGLIVGVAAIALLAGALYGLAQLDFGH
jgi:hypothetical protein